MSTLTLTKTPVAPVLPDFDRPDAETIGDEILIDAASKTRVGRVSQGTATRGMNRSAESRAWTSQGRVD